jgi:hypothetical protein
MFSSGERGTAKLAVCRRWGRNDTGIDRRVREHAIGVG